MKVANKRKKRGPWEPVYHKPSGRWIVFVPRRLTADKLKRKARYFPTKTAGEAFISEFKQDKAEHGKQAVTSDERQWIGFARAQLGSLEILPDVIQHWKRTGPGAITPTLVSDAVTAFKAVQLKRVKARTKSDISWRLDAFQTYFAGRHIHQLHAGELETFIESHKAAWSRRSFFKRLRPLFAHALRHRWIAENPMTLLKAPETPSASKLVYTGDQFQNLLGIADIWDDYLMPFLVLSGFAWIRTSEMVKLYASEQVLTWEDLDWKLKRIHVREEVGKSTRRKRGNERFVPMDKYLRNWLSIYVGKRKGPIVPVQHSEFAERMRELHASAEIPIIHNGLRRSAISHYLAAHPETGIGQLARLAGTSEATVKAHYLEALTPEAGREWFHLGRKDLDE